MAVATIDTATQLQRALEIYDLLKEARDSGWAESPETLVQAMESLNKWIEELEDLQDIEEANDVMEDIKVNGTVPWEKVQADLGLL